MILKNNKNKNKLQLRLKTKKIKIKLKKIIKNKTVRVKIFMRKFKIN